MRKRICIFLSEEMIFDLGQSLDKIPLRKIIFFNEKEANLYGAYQSYEMMGWNLFFGHPEFDEIPEACDCPVFSLEEAIKKYPFLFAYTNPLLYRRYYSNWKASWHTWRYPRS